jgi:hypothetical protein
LKHAISADQISPRRKAQEGEEANRKWHSQPTKGAELAFEREREREWLENVDTQPMSDQ